MYGTNNNYNNNSNSGDGNDIPVSTNCLQYSNSGFDQKLASPLKYFSIIRIHLFFGGTI